MPLTAWSSGLCGLVYSAFALQLIRLGYARPVRHWPRSTVLAAALMTALWAWFGVALALTADQSLWGVNTLLDMMRYACWYAFLLALIRPDRLRKKPSGLTWMAPAATALTGLHIMAILALVLHITSLGDPVRALLLSHMTLTIFALVLLEQVFRNVEEETRWSIKPLCLGLAGLFMFDLYLFAQAVLFNHPDVDAFSIRGVVHAMVVPLMMLSVMRRNDWVTGVRLSPKAAFHTTALLGAGIYLMFLSGVGYYVRYFGGEWGRALQQGLVFLGLVALVVLAFSGSARASLRVMLGKHFFHYRFDYREEWLKFTHTLSSRDASQEVGQQIVRGLADMLESPAGELWTRSQGEDSFTQTARWNLAPTQAREDISSPFCQFIERNGWVINLDEYRDHPQRYGQLTLPPWLSEMAHAWLVIPLMIEEALIGFCVLTCARTRMDVNWEVNDLLKTAGQQAAGFLTQMQATEALLEARKFEAFNRMSAFVVHDLKNIITQLTLMVKNAKRLGDNPEFQKDMLMTVENSLDRMRSLLLQLRQGATPSGPAFGVNLVALIERMAAQNASRNQPFETQWSEPLKARGHEERLERVLGHMVQNAIDATESGGRVWVQLERSGAEARIIVGDTGNGMSASFIQNRLFKPFQTTKPTGMGIGAYESLQYVRDLGGSIEVESTEGKGTVVTLLLPLFEQPNEAGFAALKYA